MHGTHDLDDYDDSYFDFCDAVEELPMREMDWDDENQRWMAKAWETGNAF